MNGYSQNNFRNSAQAGLSARMLFIASDLHAGSFYNIMGNRIPKKTCCDCGEEKYIYQFPVLTKETLGIFDTVSDRCRDCFNKPHFFDRKDVNEKSSVKKREISSKLRFEILKRDKFKCQYCGRTVNDGVKLAIDHIIPVSLGGNSLFENLITACFDCNSGKSGFDIDKPDIKYIKKHSRDKLV